MNESRQREEALFLLIATRHQEIFICIHGLRRIPYVFGPLTEIFAIDGTLNGIHLCGGRGCQSVRLKR